MSAILTPQIGHTITAPLGVTNIFSLTLDAELALRQHANIPAGGTMIVSR